MSGENALAFLWSGDQLRYQNLFIPVEKAENTSSSMSTVDLRAYPTLTKVVTPHEWENLPWIYPSECFHNPQKIQGMNIF